MSVDREKLKSFIETNNIEFKQNSNSYILKCPDCEKEEKLYIRKSDGLTVCWHCASENKKPSGSPEFILAKILGVPVFVVKKSLYDDVVYDVSKTGPYLDIKAKSLLDEYIEESPLEELPIMEVPDYFCSPGHPMFLKAQNYLARRGIPTEIIEQYQIMYNPKADRVVFPLIIDSRVRGWQDRYIGTQEFWIDRDGKQRKMPKSLTTLDRSKSLLFQERLSLVKHAVLCEGPIDALKAHLCGGNVATMGKQVAEQQLKIVMAYNPEKIYLAFDPDAFEKTMDVVKYFYSKGFTNLFLLYPPEGKKDLGECTFEEVKTQFDNAPPISPSQMLVYFAK